MALVSLVSLPSAAQQATPPSNAPAQNTTTQDTPSVRQPSTDKGKDDKDKTDQSASGQGKKSGTSNAGTSNAGTSNDRLFLALPNFLTLENTGKVPPLTTAQKFKVVARGSFDTIQFPWYGFLSAISQAENSEPGYGQGWEGYGKRFASAFADGTIENFLTSAVLPSVLRQDPRFFQSSEGGFRHRTGYAVSRIFVTRTDSGGTQFNYSEIVGSAMAAAISTNTYHPRSFITTRYNPTTNTLTYVHNASSRTLPNTASVWGTQVGYDTITIVVKEFWPDLHRKMVKKHNKEEPAQPQSVNP
ncbi:MAG TPA: hypothetical protein VKR60_03695 [Candidatus Sulfotelmatobacter sp.]|nr:hypothetical protein [Candidatus Sulfotelmatobacter sp.]